MKMKKIAVFLLLIATVAFGQAPFGHNGGGTSGGITSATMLSAISDTNRWIGIGTTTITPKAGKTVSINKLGIGQTNPGAKLDVNGDIKLGGSDNIWLNSNWLSGDGGDEGVFVASDGKVGIGTTSPATNLQAACTLTTSPRGIMSSQHNDGTDGARLHMRKSRGTNSAPTTVAAGDMLGRLIFSGFDGTNYLEMGGISGGASGTVATTRVPTYLAFETATDAAPSVLTERMRIDNAGKVGIATTSPAARLHVVGTGTTNTTLSFLAQNLAGALGLAVDDRGYVGIGKSNPGYPLDVTGNILTPRCMTSTEVQSNTYRSYTAGNITIQSSASYNQDIIIKNNGTTPTETARFTSGGNLGIGTTAPGYWQLYVGKSAYVTDTLSAAVIVDRTTWFAGDALAALSKVKGKKENSGLIDHNSLPVILKTTISTTRLKDKDTGELMPEKYTPALKDSLKFERVKRDVAGRDVGASISVLMRAVQQLVAKSDSLTARIAKLEGN
jgi:hypothetical protein